MSGSNGQHACRQGGGAVRSGPGGAGGSGAGDDFAAQYQRAYRVLWVIAASITSPGMAADIVQQAALAALGKWEQFRQGTDFTGWMAQFVRYVALNHVRSQRHRTALPLDEQQVPAAGGRSGGAAADPAATATIGHGPLPDDQALFDDELVNALNTLSDTARTCLLLRTVQDMSYAEIARTLEIAEGTAMSHVHRSRQQLRALLRDRTTAHEGIQDR